MSGKVKNKGSLNYDTHNNTMALEGDLDDQTKYKINKVLEVVKHRSQEDVLLVLQFYDYDVDTTVDAFLEDGAADILKKWNHTNAMKPTNKNKKKKKNKKKNSVQENASASSAAVASETVNTDESTIADAVPSAGSPLSNGDSSPPLEVGSSHEEQEVSRDSSLAAGGEDADGRVSPLHSQTDEVKIQESHFVQRLSEQESPAIDRLTDHKTPEPESTSSSSTTVVNSGVPEVSSISPSDHARSSSFRNRHRSSGSLSRAVQESSRTETSFSQPPAPVASSSAPSAPGKKILDKSLKDLSRQTVALHRVSNLLEEELDNSFKRIKTAISEAQRLLEDRSQDLEQEMERVKKESRQLLTQRKDQATELKLRAERASTMGEAELNELRADIKHFVVERKYDEELGKTRRFMWDKDRITTEIKSFGEVYHVKNCYSQRRQSVSSVASSSNMTSSITEPPESLPVNQTELDQEVSAEPNHESTVPMTRPQGSMFSNKPRVFFRSDSNRQGYNRGTYPPRGRGGGENRGGRGGMRGGRRDDGYRSYDASSGYKPYHSYQKSDDHSTSAGGGSTESGNGAGNTNSWPPRDQRAIRRGSGRHNPRYQARVQSHHSPRHNYSNDERVQSEARLNGNKSSDLLNGFVDH